MFKFQCSRDIKKIQKSQNPPDLAVKHTVASTETPSESKKISSKFEDTSKEDTEVILHITESEEELFPAENKEECNIVERRRVYINNEWKIADTSGKSDFDELISN